MKKIITLLLCAIGAQSFAQSFSDGVYSTNFGTINLTFEQGFEYPNGGIVYGDYKGIGTITGSTTNVGKEIVGSFHNGAAEGKFIFFSPTGKQHFFDSGITSFNGNWGYEIDNKYSTNPDHIWKATSKTAGKDAIKNVTNVWSGKWNTTDGSLILLQTGNKVTGTYKNVGTVDGVYNPQTRKLKGTFYNNTTKKTGHFEFDFEGNSFKGKWGWTTAMTDGAWNGDKHVKNNKAIATTSTSSNSSTSANSNQSQNNQKVKYRFHLAKLNAPLIATISNPLLNLYGFSGIRVYRVTASGREEVKSFGNKSHTFFDRTEDNAFPENRESVSLPETPANYRDFEFLSSDINNNTVDIEVEFWHHLKGKRPGINADYGKTRQTLTMEQIISAMSSNGMDRIFIGSSCELGKIKNRDQSYITVQVKKID